MELIKSLDDERLKEWGIGDYDGLMGKDFALSDLALMKDSLRAVIAERDAALTELAVEKNAVAKLAPACASLLARAENAEAELAEIKERMTEERIARMLFARQYPDYPYDEAIPDLKNLVHGDASAVLRLMRGEEG